MQTTDTGRSTEIDRLGIEDIASIDEELTDDLLQVVVGGLRPSYAKTYCFDGEEWYVCDFVD